MILPKTYHCKSFREESYWKTSFFFEKKFRNRNKLSYHTGIRTIRTTRERFVVNKMWFENFIFNEIL